MSKKNLMDIVYVHAGDLAFHEDENGLIVLDRENKGFYNGIAQRFFKRPRVSHISMDGYGTALWKLLDGERDVFSVVGEMKKAFPQEEDKMLERCVRFLGILESNRFITRKKQ